MYRKKTLNKSLFYGSENIEIGFIKEIVLSEDKKRLDAFIIHNDELNDNYIIDLNNIIFKENESFTSSKENLKQLDILNYYNKLKENERFFAEKDILSKEKNIIGKTLDYIFDSESGNLEKIIYNTEENQQEEIEASYIIENSEGYLLIDIEKKKEKIRQEKLEEERIKQEKIRKEQEENKKLLEKEFKNLFSELAKKYENQIEKEQGSYKELYKEFEKDVLNNLTNLIENIQEELSNKKEEFFNSILRAKQEEFFSSLSDDYAKALNKINQMEIFEPSDAKSNIINETIKEENKKENNIDGLFDLNKELEKLYELQRKRIDIVKKLKN